MSHLLPNWLDRNGDLIACKEKNKVMRENLEEFRQVSQDILEDALLMGCQEVQIKEVMLAIVSSLESPYQE
ncbi:MAG: hypothetical protein WDW19_04690 [Neisseriaceae bacterium]